MQGLSNEDNSAALMKHRYWISFGGHLIHDTLPGGPLFNFANIPHSPRLNSTEVEN